jgi:type III secretory pathway lipoprotein EscJ
MSKVFAKRLRGVESSSVSVFVVKDSRNQEDSWSKSSSVSVFVKGDGVRHGGRGQNVGGDIKSVMMAKF